MSMVRLASTYQSIALKEPTSCGTDRAQTCSYIVCLEGSEMVVPIKMALVPKQLDSV